MLMPQTNEYMFDTIYDRRFTDSHKWNKIPEDSLSMWLADMDFRTPAPILDALRQKVSTGFLGYPAVNEQYLETVLNWFTVYHHYNTEGISIIPVTGIIPALSAIIQRYTSEGAEIIIQAPAYYRFMEITENRTILFNPLKIDEHGEYQMDFEHLDSLLPLRPQIFVLCSPHNPVGRVWSYEDLLRIAEYCLENEILLIADEIHCDLVLPGYHFTSVATLPTRYLQNTIILHSSTKTFNIAGLRGGHVVVFNQRMQKELSKVFDLYGINKVNTAFLTATMAGYTHCHDWTLSLNKYLAHNYHYIQTFIQEHIPQLKTFPLEATYLMWIDYRALQISEDDFFSVLDQELIVSKGTIFSEYGKGFFRINIACPLDMIKRAMQILHTQINHL